MVGHLACLTGHLEERMLVTKRIVMKVKVMEKRGNTGGRKNEKKKNSHFSLMKCNRVGESTVDLSSSN